MTENETQIVLRAQAGDPEAFRALLERYQKPVFAILYRFLGNRFADEIEDYAQDIFIKIFRSIGSFDFAKHTKFSTWLYASIKHYSIDILKKKRLRSISIQGGKFAQDGETMDLRGRELSPIQTLGREELAGAIAKAVSTLPIEQREVFILREYEKLSLSEIAKVIRRSEGTVKSRLHRAKDALRTRLSPYLRNAQQLTFSGEMKP